MEKRRVVGWLKNVFATVHTDLFLLYATHTALLICVAAGCTTLAEHTA
jgi:hypothetical protein